ncbi:hypothetical protein MYX84_00420 [Acidobacteria bacterium AH-259-O06]|nr:hypothetical protein [Acidobacteria bacterium AH-259-O06]
MIEAVDAEVNQRLLTAILSSLLTEPVAYGAEAHPAVWMNVLYQPENNRFIVGFLNYQETLPVVPISRLSFWLRAPEGRRIVGLRSLPDGTEINYTVNGEGTLHAEVDNLDVFKMLAVELA